MMIPDYFESKERMSIMKQFWAVLTVLFVLLAAVPGLAEEYPELKGGSNIATATEITESMFGIEYEGKVKYSMYYTFVAPRDGRYYLSLEALTTFQGASWRGAIYDRLGNVIEEYRIATGTHKVFAYDLSTGERITFYIVNGFNDQIYHVSVCTDTAHSVGLFSEITQTATCNTVGIRSYPCELCDQVVYEEELPKLSHTPGEWLTETAATCTMAGTLVQRCTMCNETIATQELPATGHAPGASTVTLEATCLQAGLRTVQCGTCGEVLESETIPLADHTLGRMINVKAATCTDAGRNEQHCAVCNATLATETIEPFGHTPGAWVDQPAATCTADGLSEQHCAVCNVVLNTETVSAFGHSPQGWTVTREAACLQSGLRERICSTCGVALEQDEIPALGHHYTEWEITIEATKDREGEERRNCIHCGDTQFEKIPKIPKILGIF